MTTPILRRDKIFIRDMAFHANHGAFEHEKDYPQRFMIDFEGEMFLAPPAETDEVRDTVRYDLVAETIREVVEGNRYNLIETLAEEIAEKVLATYAGIETVHLRVRKPQASVPVLCSEVGVEIFRRRERRG
ncbi:MAG: dihydroneopterin aldolase [Rhodobiaceae bacterium]|nr:dihydroneopterin aldolase [Rhodobiaceae bacterium]MCC0061479.1 dihydroneopterin aldolase [Rhodobiaceae bacterium]